LRQGRPHCLEGCAYHSLVQAIPKSVGTAIVREWPLVRKVYRSIGHAHGWGGRPWR